MSRSIWFLVAAMAVVASLAACGPAGREPLTLREEDASKTVELGVGHTLLVELKGNPTTGYQWEVESLDTGMLKQVGEPEFKPDSDLTGAGGKFTFRFEGAAAGEADLRLVYHRPWEKDAPPEETFEVTVVVK